MHNASLLLLFRSLLPSLSLCVLEYSLHERGLGEGERKEENGQSLPETRREIFIDILKSGYVRADRIPGSAFELHVSIFHGPGRINEAEKSKYFDKKTIIRVPPSKTFPPARQPHFHFFLEFIRHLRSSPYIRP